MASQQKYPVGYVFETKYHGPLEVVERINSYKFIGKFLNTGATKEVDFSTARRGNVSDPTSDFNPNVKMDKIGKVLSHPTYGNYLVLSRDVPNKIYRIKFERTGVEVEVSDKRLYKNQVTDPEQLRASASPVQVGKTFQSKRYGFYRVIEKQKGGKVLVEFLETGYQKWTTIGKVLQGGPRDDSIPLRHKNKIYKGSDDKSICIDVGATFHNNSGQEFEVLEVDGSKRIKVKFLESGFERYIQAAELRVGKVKDYGSPSVHGVGIIGSCEKTDPIIRKTWQQLIRRHVDPDYSCTVCDEWLNLSNFKRDFTTLPRYNEWYESKLADDQLSYHIDKDLKIPGNTVYSLQTVTLLPAHINVLEARIRKNLETETCEELADALRNTLDVLRNHYCS